MFELITTFYKEQNKERRNEFLQALKLNAENTQIHKVYVLCESGKDLIADLSLKIQIITLEKRPKFYDIILFANGLQTHNIKIISNTDIYFDDSLSKATKIKNKEVYCLTRWNLSGTGRIDFFPNFKSQDSWIFRNSLPDNMGNYYMGVPGCDNRLAAELGTNGFKISNPSLTIRSIHLHRTDKRNYNKVLDRVPGEYAYSLPCYLHGEIQNKVLQRFYFLVRRKYYSSIYNKSLEGVKCCMLSRIVAFCFMNYYKLRLKLF